MADIRIEDIRRQLADIAVKQRLSGEAAQSSDFSKMLENAVDRLNQEQLGAEQKIQDFVAGRETSLHNTLITLEKADISFKMMMQVRGKLLDAYQEIMRTNV